jgi:hypothetical protein
VAVILRTVENINKAKPNFDGQLLPQPIESTLVILGYGALFINFIFLFCCVGLLIFNRIKQIPKWIVIANLVFFILELFNFFF